MYLQGVARRLDRTSRDSARPLKIIRDDRWVVQPRFRAPSIHRRRSSSLGYVRHFFSVRAEEEGHRLAPGFSRIRFHPPPLLLGSVHSFHPRGLSSVNIVRKFVRGTSTSSQRKRSRTTASRFSPRPLTSTASSSSSFSLVILLAGYRSSGKISRHRIDLFAVDRYRSVSSLTDRFEKWDETHERVSIRGEPVGERIRVFRLHVFT